MSQIQIRTAFMIATKENYVIVEMATSMRLPGYLRESSYTCRSEIRLSSFSTLNKPFISTFE